jgi:hypothetical protein
MIHSYSDRDKVLQSTPHGRRHHLRSEANDVVTRSELSFAFCSVRRSSIESRKQPSHVLDQNSTCTHRQPYTRVRELLRSLILLLTKMTSDRGCVAARIQIKSRLRGFLTVPRAAIAPAMMSALLANDAGLCFSGPKSALQTQTQCLRTRLVLSGRRIVEKHTIERLSSRI